MIVQGVGQGASLGKTKERKQLPVNARWREEMFLPGAGKSRGFAGALAPQRAPAGRMS